MANEAVPIPPDLTAALRAGRRVVVLSGAGISAESGVPTFRDAQTGHWARFRPEDLATPEAFRRNPKLVWDWYAARRAQLQRVTPNPGHHALVQMERRLPHFLIATQNVDGLHARAGSRQVLELHGNITRTKCFTENLLVDAWTDGPETPPKCPRCGGWLRPDVVWFNEMLPAAIFEEGQAASARCEVFLSVGTSALVYPAASLPLEALRAGAVLVEINPQPTPLTPHATHFLCGPSGQVLPALVRAAWPDAHPESAQ
ncbi:MAG TPA: NAD-dependent deacylase [Verrucomicrobiae bacterium]|jgi:NAD-dependent deacetylase|nr:NAD-dependent deacylase [Verrucomicrobiae bacterium]